MYVKYIVYINNQSKLGNILKPIEFKYVLRVFKLTKGGINYIFRYNNVTMPIYIIVATTMLRGLLITKDKEVW